MTWSTNPNLGGFVLSGSSNISLKGDEIIIEHSIPGRIGGLTERVGSKATTIKIQGFFDSGDISKNQILGLPLQTVQFLTIPSTISGQYFFSGVVFLDDFVISPQKGYGYPYYKWTLDCTQSGIPSMTQFLLGGGAPLTSGVVPISGVTPINGSGYAGVIVPFYEYPDHYYTDYTALCAANQQIPAIAILNPFNGPVESPGQTQPDPIFTAAVSNWHSANIKVIGYVATEDGTKVFTSAQYEIAAYSSWYGLDGIFFDQMNNVTGSESYYAGLTSYAHSLGLDIVFGNPGTTTPASYVGTVDNLMIYENYQLPSIAYLETATAIGANQRSGFSMIAYGVPSIIGNRPYFMSAAGLLSWMYVTTQGNGSTVPAYTLTPTYLPSLFAFLTAVVPTS